MASLGGKSLIYGLRAEIAKTHRTPPIQPFMRLIKVREYFKLHFFRLLRLLATSKSGKRSKCDNRNFCLYFSLLKPSRSSHIYDAAACVQLAHALIKSHEPPMPLAQLRFSLSIRQSRARTTCSTPLFLHFFGCVCVFNENTHNAPSRTGRLVCCGCFLSFSSLLIIGSRGDCERKNF